MGHLVCWILIFFPPSSSGQLVTGWEVLTSRKEPSALARGLVRITNKQKFAVMVPQVALCRAHMELKSSLNAVVSPQNQ